MSAQIVADTDGRVISWDSEAARMLGYPADEMVGRLLGETIVPARYREQHDRGVRDFRATGSAPAIGKRMQVAAVRKDGTEIPIDLRITQLSVNPPTFLGLIDQRTPMSRPDDPYTGSEHRAFAAEVETARAGRAAMTEEDRIERATKLRVEAEMARRQAEGLTAEVGALTVEVGHLRRTAERMEAELGRILTAMTASAEVMRSYGSEQLAPRERARFPGVLLWFGGMLDIVANSGKTGVVLLGELLDARATKMHMSKAGVAILIAIVPFLVAIFSVIIARLVGGNK
jgi:PAS domain S-box-containing protein